MAKQDIETYIHLKVSQQVEIRNLADGSFRLGSWYVEPRLNRLTRGDESVQLELKVMDVLVCLAERAGEMVPRQEIVDTVWATEFIADNTLTHAITEIRNAFGDDAKKPSFIETIHRRGYRLIASVESVVSDEPGISKVARFPVPERAMEDDRNPYPGLAAFTEEDAEFFFGREAEVAQMWRKLTNRRLLAVIGPSGVGKSSFLRAGVIPAKPEGWDVVVCQPGEAPLPALARALAQEFAGDAEAVEGLVGMADPDKAVAMVSRWRDRHERTLLVVDQFEELFTLNPPQVQEEFAVLLRRFVDEAGIHVLIAMRDDFLYRCHALTRLAPIFEDLTPLAQPSGDALRSALAEPAARLGYALEDESLADEMVAEVAEERGALPLLAFAVARLWEKRDRERHLLTRQAHEGIGGVGGALARHAEATLTAIGHDRLAIVRELFRNLITAEGTRAIREVEDLLSVFPDPQRQEAQQVLRRLIDARLLTSFEDREADGADQHRVEVVHESLLTSWPRLVGWQTQDADAARMRDELRQAARTWKEHGRHRDRLWSGAAYREFVVWRDRYPGSLSQTEGAFAQAMTVHAGRRRRRRRFAAAAVIIGLSIVLAIVAVSRQQALAEARRAEAARLLAMGQLELDDDHAAALAYATASLELSDSAESRVFVVTALSRGPTTYVVPIESLTGDFRQAAFSPDGSWLVATNYTDTLRLWSDSGEQTKVPTGHGDLEGGLGYSFSSDGELLVTASTDVFKIWSVPDWKLVREVDFDEDSTMQDRRMSYSVVLGDRLVRCAFKDGRYLLRSWPHHGGEPSVHGWWDPKGTADWGPDLTGRRMEFARGKEIISRPLEDLESAGADRVLWRHEKDILWYTTSPGLDRIAAIDDSGEVHLWPLGANSQQPRLSLRGPEVPFRFDPTGTRLIDGGDNAYRIWDLTGPPDAEPLVITAPKLSKLYHWAFHPSGLWLVVADDDRLLFWPLKGHYPRVLNGQTGIVKSLTFADDGRRLLSASLMDGTVREWPLSPEGGESGRVLWERPGGIYTVAADPAFEHILVAHQDANPGSAFLVTVGGDRPGETNLWPPNTAVVGPVTFSADGRHAAAGTWHALDDEETVIRVWDLQLMEEQVLALRDEDGDDTLGAYERGVTNLCFMPDGDLLSAGYGGVRRWDLQTREGQWLTKVPEDIVMNMDCSRDGRFLLTVEKPTLTSLEGSNLSFHDLALGDSRSISTHGDRIYRIALDPTGTIIVTADAEGVIRVGTGDDREPNLLLGHEGPVTALTVSPGSRWIASAHLDGTIRLWPMPDLSKPPLHTLPHDELIAKLKTLTNLRVVRDEDSPTGWKLTHDPFPGWKEVPTW